MTLLIGINFSSEHRLYNINCVHGADKYLVTGKNCAQAKLELAIKRYFVGGGEVNAVGLNSKR